MPNKQTNIVILLVIVAIAIFVVFNFFNLPSLSGSAPGAVGPAKLLNEISQTGSISALQVYDTTEGTGDPVVVGDTLTVHYTGVLPDGTVFDSSRTHGEPFTFTIGDGYVIQGWEQGLLGMRVGGQRLIAVPPSLGYGDRAVGNIPANSTLIFDVELLSRTSAQ